MSALILVVIAVACGVILIIVNLKLVVFNEKFVEARVCRVHRVFCLKANLGIFYITSVLLLMFRPILTHSVLIGKVRLLRGVRLVQRGDAEVRGLGTSVSRCRAATICLGSRVVILIGMFTVALFREFTLFATA